MDITVLYVEACPHLGLARARIADALDQLGEPAAVTERLIRTPADATAAGFHGSPTILVNGRDPFPADGTSALSCRLYRTEAGLEGAPTVTQLVEALASDDQVA